MKALKRITMALFAVAALTAGFVSCANDEQDVNVQNMDQDYSYVYQRWEYGKTTEEYVQVEWTKKANSNYTDYSIPGAGSFRRIGSKIYNSSEYDYTRYFSVFAGDSEFYYSTSGTASATNYKYRYIKM